MHRSAMAKNIRRQAAKAGDKIHIRNVRPVQFAISNNGRDAGTTTFAVDASGSSALSRLARKPKAWSKMMLAQAYVKRTVSCVDRFPHRLPKYCCRLPGHHAARRACRFTRWWRYALAVD
jgi:hypothetical protein